jgi:pilus assembly protein CpaC
MTSLLRAIVAALFACSALIPQHAAAQPAKTTLLLAVGEQRVIPSAGVSSYSEGTRGIVDVRLTPNATSFVVVGQRPGHTSLLLMMEDGEQRVFEIDVTDPQGSRSDGAQSKTVTARDNVRLDFYFVQISNQYRHKLGLSWPGTLGGGTFSAGFDFAAGRLSNAQALVSDQALPQLDMAQSRGWAKLLRQAAFVTANGSQAQLSGGGELNVPVTGGLGGTLKQISFGTAIQVLPRYDRDTGRIELTIQADVSDLASDGGTGVPGRTTSNLQSVVNLELGQSVVLAGLRSQSENDDNAGLPWLHEIPVLGALFGADTRKREASETLIFIVPTVVDTVSLSARAAIDDALRVFDTYDGDLAKTQLTGATLPHPAHEAPRE